MGFNNTLKMSLRGDFVYKLLYCRTYHCKGLLTRKNQVRLENVSTASS